MLRVSVVIPCRRVTGELRQSLRAVLALSPPVLEVLVFPDAPVGETWSRTRFLPTGAIGPAMKRDLALRHAQGELLAFLDDDAYPAPHWLRSALRHFSDPSVAAVGGPAVTAPDDGLWAHVSGGVFTSWLGSGPARSRHWPVGGVRLVDDWPSVNLVVRRDVFIAVGGFGTAFWPGEDTKLCLKIQRAGKRILYDPEAIVYHHRATTPLKHLRQVARYGLHRGFFAKWYPATSRRVSYILPSGIVLGLLAAFALGTFSPAARAPLLVLAGIFGAMLVGASLIEAARARRLLLILLMPPLLLATHVTYGASFLRGLRAPSLRPYQRGGR